MRIHTRPSSPGATSRPCSPRISTVTPGTGLPTDPTRISADGGLTDASPTSVSPYASSITSPVSSVNSRSSSADTQSPAARHSRSEAKSCAAGRRGRA